jgi:hypothetical protein
MALLGEAQVNLSAQTRVLAVVLAALFVAAILELVRRHRLQERYTVIWLVAGAVMMVGAIVPDQTIGSLARLLGVSDTNAALFSLVILMLLALALHLTVVVSRQSEQITRLAQDLAIERADREQASADVADQVLDDLRGDTAVVGPGVGRDPVGGRGEHRSNA